MNNNNGHRYNMSHLLSPPESVGSNPSNSGNSRPNNNGGARGGNNNSVNSRPNNNGGARGGNNKNNLNRKIAILEAYLGNRGISQTNRNASEKELFKLYAQKYGNGTKKPNNK